MEFENITISELLKETSSKSLTPGGGSITALTGALSTALASMVCNITLNNKEYESVYNTVKGLLKKLNNLQIQLLDAAQNDTEYFNELMITKALPKDTLEEKNLRKNRLYESYKDLVMVSINIARIAVEILPILAVLIKDGNKSVITDIIIAAMLARTTALSAIVNVRYNLRYVSDDNYVKIIMEECNVLEDYAIDQEAYVAAIEPSLTNIYLYTK